MAGLALAVATIVTPGAQAVKQPLPRDAVAVVNGHEISASRYEEALNSRTATAAQRTAEVKRRILDSLVDEELLVQRAIELELHQTDPNIRNALVTAVLALDKAPAKAPTPDEDELALFYEQAKTEFEQPAAMQLRQILVRSSGPEDDARARAVAQRAASMLRAGMAFDHVCLVSECEPVDPALPLELTPVPLLEASLGPEIVDAVQPLEAGEVTPVISIERTHRVLQVVKNQPAQIPPLEEVLTQVIQRFRYRQQRAHLQETLATLRETSDITVRATQ